MNDIGLLRGEHGLVVLVGLRDAEALLEALAALGDPVAHGHQVHVIARLVDLLALVIFDPKVIAEGNQFLAHLVACGCAAPSELFTIFLSLLSSIPSSFSTSHEPSPLLSSVVIYRHS